MPRPAAGARLYCRPDTKAWIIRDKDKSIRTGFSGPDGKPDADQALALYILKKNETPKRPQSQEDVGLDVVLGRYLNTLREDMADPKRQAYAVQALLPFWQSLTVADVDEEACKRYTKMRSTSSTARRELSVLRAALNKAYRDKLLLAAPAVWLPPKSEAKPDWLTRDEFAKLLWELRKNKRTRHAAKLALCQFYTGSRPRTVGKTTWEQREDGPWLDLSNNIWWRAGNDEAQTVKRRRPHQLPPSLRRHLERWKTHRRLGQVYVVEHPRHPGKPVLDIGKALESACERAGIKRITPHTLKHTAITLAIQSGMSAEDAVDYFSTSIETIQRNYWHHSPFYQKRAASIMDRLGR